MADPLSIAAGVIAVLQATNKVLEVCYNFKTALNNGSWALTSTIAEVRDLRGVIEDIDALVDCLFDDTDSEKGDKTRSRLEILCEGDQGPLATCARELRVLEKKVLAAWSSKAGTKLRAFKRAISWSLNEDDVKISLQRIERCKSTLKLAITVDEIYLLREIHEMTSALNSSLRIVENDVKKLAVNLRATELESKEKSIVKWLATTDPYEQHEGASNLHDPSTSSWFLDSQIYESWLAAEMPYLWLSGFPGAGKTVLFSKILSHTIEKISDSSNTVALAYFYCDFRQSDTRSVQSVIGSLVSQLCVTSADFPSELHEAFERCTGTQNKRPSNAELVDVVLAIASKRRIVLLLDAIDEIERSKKLLNFLQTLQMSDARVSILVTGREDVALQEGLSAFKRLKLEDFSKEVDEDIRRYIDYRLRTDKRLSWLSDAMRLDIAQSLVAKSAGMFRWVQCQLDSICSLRTVKAIRRALDTLPKGLYETYERILDSVQEEDRIIVRRILLWLSFTVLPLRLAEIHEAIAIEEDVDHLDDESRLSSPEDVLILCGNLIQVSEAGELALAHLSVKDYISSSAIAKSLRVATFRLEPVKAYEELAISCLRYLSFCEFESGPSESAETFAARVTQNVLMRHASTGWAYYAKLAGESAMVNGAIAKFFGNTQRQNFMSWVQVLNADANFKWDLYPRFATSLYYAASFGLVEVVRSMVEDGVELNAPGSRFGGTALHGAVFRNHIDVMDILLAAGANPNKADFNGVSPLHTAVVHGTPTVISTLLKFGADGRAIDGMGETPFDWATKSNETISLELLQGRRSSEAHKATPTSPQNEIWRPKNSAYFPNFYGRRSGMDSSIILSVSIGTDRPEVE